MNNLICYSSYPLENAVSHFSFIRPPAKQTVDHLYYNGLDVQVRYLKSKIGILLEFNLDFAGSLLQAHLWFMARGHLWDPFKNEVFLEV